MKNINIILVIISIFYAPLTNANHLNDKSDSEALSMHKFRSNVLVHRHQSEIIPPAKKPEMIKDTSKPNGTIRNIIDQSDLLSVLFYDGNSITVNELSTTKLKPLNKMYSMSISKSYIGYLLGHAICDGFIKTLDDSIGQYVPETSGTIYEGVSLQNMINMTAGDVDHWERGSNNMIVYAGPIVRGKKTIKDMLEESRGVSPVKKPNFYYSNILPDLVGRAIHLKSPLGLKDKNEWGIHFAFLYATRGDYLKFAKLIAQDWKSNSCIGSYLKKLYENRVPTGKPQNGSHNFQSYGGFFWMDKSNFNFPHFVMNGHGGQRIIINLNTGAILSMHAIRSNYNQTEVEELLFE